MKSKLLLVLAASFLLVGCNESTITSEESKSKESQTSESITSQEGSESSEISSEESSSEESSSEQSSSEESSESIVQGNKTLSVTFLNNEDFPKGGLPAKDHENFISAFNGETDLLASFTNSQNNLVQISNNTSEDCYINSTLQLGSRSGAGEIDFTFNYPVTRVTVQVQAYWTAYSYSGQPLTYNVDENANICIGNDNNYVDLKNAGGAEPEKVTKSFDFNNATEIKLYDVMDCDDLPDKQGQRVYIHSMEITYVD